MKNILKVENKSKNILTKVQSLFERQETRFYFLILVKLDAPGSGSGTAKRKRIHADPDRQHELYFTFR